MVNYEKLAEAIVENIEMEEEDKENLYEDELYCLENLVPDSYTDYNDFRFAISEMRWFNNYESTDDEDWEVDEELDADELYIAIKTIFKGKIIKYNVNDSYLNIRVELYEQNKYED